ncbi:MAG: ATP-binding cassette domain-containing protein [Gammaproteobacteria bacterium]|nr:ATP-binding cassette domain-containing protein [Gammaproteobacteria bacterium]
MNSSTDAQRKRYAELNALRNTTQQQTQTLLTHAIKGKHHTSTASESPETIQSASDALGVRTILRQVFIDNASTFATMMVVYFIIAGLSALLTISIGHIIAHHLAYTDLPTISQFILFLTAISVTVGIFSIIRTLIFATFEVSIIYHVQSIIMKHLFSLPVSFFEQYATGDLCHRVLMIEPLARLSGQHQIGVLLSFTFSTISFLTMLYFAWQLTLITLAIVSVYLVFSIMNIKKQLPHIEKYMGNSGGTAAFTFNMNSGMSRIKVFCSDVFAEAQWAKLYSDTRQKLSHIYRLGIWRFTITNTILLLTLMIVFFLATHWKHNQLPLEYTIIFYAAFIQFMCGVVSFSMQLNELAFTICAFRRLKPILKTHPEHTPPPSKTTPSPAGITGAISMNNIQFSYPHSKRLILDGLTCSVAKGEHLAIVGLSGAGKSTVLKLLLGFYSHQQGDILFDDTAIQHFNISELRQQIGVVFQDSKLMTGTLLTNIIDGCADMTEEDAWHVADLVGLKAFISALPMKMHTLVSQHLNVLSGGQKQLILIARALVGKPRLLLLDEATNSLDPTTQHHIAKVIRGLPITCILIAHRLSTIQYADNIMVLHKGRITEQGSYHQLLQAQGLFYQLAITQKLHGQRQEHATIEA